MTLKRTPSALLSMPLFYKVDVVVFCEGGPSRTVAEALAYSSDGRTLDAIYWANVVECQKHTKRFHFKSVGDKATLKTIADDVALAGCSNVTVCLDSDYDVYLGKMPTGDRVARTFGYSWESDILHRPVVERVLTHLVGPPPPDLSTAVDHALSQLSDELARWCEIDIALRAKGKACVFDREKPLSVVDLTSDPPWICVVSLRRRLAMVGYKRGPRRIVAVRPGSVLHVAYGKLVSKLLYHLVVKFAVRIVPRLRIDYDSFMRIAIAETFGLLRSGQLPEFAAHVNSQRLAFA